MESSQKKWRHSCLTDMFPKIFIVMLFLASATFAFAQGRSITGVVLDDLSEPVIGANVSVQGTTNGTITDMDGKFTLSGVADNALLNISYIGYITQTIPVAGKSNFNITLKEDLLTLDEVVVVGYGVQRKSDVTGALVRVDSEALNVKPVSNAFEALQGKAAGVDITSSERPGTLGSVRIRGNRSLTATNSPLYVVDGVPLNSGGIETINPRDIESIDILKDASSTAIYGSRGANGVILVTTRRGKSGSLQLNYSGSMTFEKLIDNSPAMSASDYITWRRWAYHNTDPVGNPRGDQPNYEKDQAYFSGDPYALANVNKGWSGNSWDGSKVSDTDWAGFVTQTGLTHEHTLSASGGTENMQAFFSFGYLNNEGTQKGQEYERYNAAMSVDIQAKPWFKAGGSLNASWSVQDYGFSRTGQSSNSGPVDIYNAAKAIPRYAVPYDDNGDIVMTPAGSATNVYTVIDEWNKSTDNRQTFRALGSFYGLVDFGKIWEPLAGLSYKIAFGPDFRHYRQGNFISSQSAAKMGGKNYARQLTERHFSWTLDNMIMYSNTFNQHHIDVTLLQSASKYNRENGSMSANMIPNENFLWYNMGSVDITDAATYGAGMSTGLSENQLASYMARVNYSLMDRYLLTVSGRYDGSSVLAKGNKWSFFPSAALGWRIDQEEFLNPIEWLDQLKVRVGVGVTGNSAVGAYSTLGNIQSFFVPFGSTLTQAYATNEPYYTSSSVSLANKDLGWEKTTQYNYGIDFSFLRGRVNGTLDIYHSNTNDLLMSMGIPTLTGYPSTLANVGKTKNHGVDITLNLVPVQIKDFEWVSSINAAYQKDEIVELSNGKEDDISNSWFIGQSIGVHYGYDSDGLWQESDAAEMAKFNENGHKFSAGSVKPVDQDKNYKIDEDDRVILGNKNPNWTLGWMNTFSYKGFDLSVELYGRFGYMISTGGEGQFGMYNQREIDYWTPNNTDADWQKPVYSTAGGDSYSSLLGFKDASFIKLRNISLGYNLSPKTCRSIGFQSLKIYAQAKNLGNLYSSVDFIDLDLGTTFYNRGFTLGIQVGF
ncbi:TonB-linked SusC/RagA family outer membrane protein [Parabacteroides sp. PFB2-12]|nr:TonB-linked SusC/RagA family outer membrane protein [Parabacteroides sp. PM6-13]MDH6390052.1 TonB-linked SusC/RagA family outer membrane protein [Parabacteroides sp. PFB2-12]